MNRKGTPPNLTFMIIGTFAFVAIITLGVLATNQFTESNSWLNQTDDSNYNTATSNITGQQSSLHSQLVSPFESTNLLTRIFAATTTIFTTAVIGVESLLSLLVLPGIINNMFDTIASGIGFGGEAIIILKTFFISILGIYMGMKILQAIRGNPQQA